MYFLLIYAASIVILSEASTIEQLSRIPEVRRFQQYIQIDTVTGKDLTPAVNFWRRHALIARAKFSTYEAIEGYPVVILKWPGKNSSLPSMALLTHMDVVPADMREGWTYPPFSAHIDDNGDIYGRGTQEKSVTMQQYEAIMRMRKQSAALRDVYMILTPDKETGSRNGIALYLKSKSFKELNVGFFLTIGVPSMSEDIALLYRGKTRWSFEVKCTGPSGDSTLLIDPAVSADGMCGRFYMAYTKYRNGQYEAAEESGFCDMDNITVINFVGPKVNTVLGVIPSTINLYYDSFLAVNTSFAQFKKIVYEWLEEAGPNTKLRTLLRQDAGPDSVVDEDNSYYRALEKASISLDIAFCPRSASQPEEASYVAAAGYPVFGLSPIISTENLVHAVNERLNIHTFLNGITIYEEIFKQLFNLSPDEVSNNSSDYLMPNTPN
ncbi:PREDICTED: aminoacylase-1-like [Papilio xuthus]|uniref:Aminoacylase-1 n=1 Tax=Papilio xuthus TaxID=66420 RepID=A0A194PNU3_PAPXU|nr:Aminoacylase-1 [Papilio xuthus]